MRAPDISAALTGRIEFLCSTLLPNGRKIGRHWHVGSIYGEPGDSLKICLKGDKAGRWCDFANADHYGDPLDLVRFTTTGSTVEAMDWARKWLGVLPAEIKRPATIVAGNDDDHDAVNEAKRIWHEARNINGTLVEQYLRCRGLDLDLPPTLRFHAGPVTINGRPYNHPAMAAAIERWPDREVRAVQVTFLRPDGKDRIREKWGKLTRGPRRGGAVRLAPMADTLAIGEGVETALAYQQMTGVSCWAACGSDLSSV